MCVCVCVYTTAPANMASAFIFDTSTDASKQLNQKSHKKNKKEKNIFTLFLPTFYKALHEPTASEVIYLFIPIGCM